MNERLLTPENSQDTLRRHLEALTDRDAYLKNLKKGKPVAAKRLPKVLFPLQTTDANVAIVTFYQEPNFLVDATDLHYQKEIDFLAPAGTPVIAPEDGYIVRAYTTQLIRDDAEVKSHEDAAEVVFSALSGMVYVFAHLSQSHLPNGAEKLKTFPAIGNNKNIIFVKQGQQISTVAQWDIPWSYYEETQQALPPRVKQHFASLGKVVDPSHVELETFDFRPYAKNPDGNFDGMSYQRGFFTMNSFREFNPLHLLPRLFSEK